MKKYLIVFDFFAGTFSVTKTVLLFCPDFQKSKIELLKIFSVEKSKELSFDFFQTFLKNNPLKKKVKVYCSDVLSNNFETKILFEFETVLKGLFQTIGVENENFQIFVLFFAGPPCQNYSMLQVFNSKNKNVQNVENFQNKLKYSDSLVLKTLTLYESVRRICMNYPSVFAGIVIENPWSVDVFRFYDENDLFFDRGYKHITFLSLRKRDFIQPFLFENGGFLKITKHNWCQYDYLNFPKKTTAIFSDISEIDSNICKHKGKHPINVLSLKTSSECGKYPDAFVQYCIFFLYNIKKTYLI